MTCVMKCTGSLEGTLFADRRGGRLAALLEGMQDKAVAECGSPGGRACGHPDAAGCVEGDDNVDRVVRPVCEDGPDGGDDKGSREDAEGRDEQPVAALQPRRREGDPEEKD